MTRTAFANLAATIVLAVPALAGCETINQDLGDLAKGFMPPSPAEAARMALDPHDADRRREGTLLLCNAPFGAADVYLAMYRDYVAHEQDPLVKAVAVRALGRHGAPQDATLLVGQAAHESVQVRWEVAKSLQRLHHPAAVPALLGFLRDEEEHADVRVAAAIALGQYPEDRVVQGLIAALDARELSINLAAKQSLEVLTGQTLGPEPRPWFSWYNARTDDPFAGRREYLYPTYHREDTFLEKIAFWSSRVEEQPAPPAGLRPSSERSTYGDGDGDGDDEADGVDPEPTDAGG